jgi:hypothetical protein
MVRHCFSYVVYGNNSKYFDPIFKNNQILKASKLEYTIIIFAYISSNLSERLKREENILVVDIPKNLQKLKRLARFLAPNFVSAEFYHYRDSDSLITKAELDIVLLQEALSLPATIIRNHPLHFAPILAGLFSLEQSFANELRNISLKPNIRYQNYYDQIFLSRFFYLKIRTSAIVFTSSFYYKGENICKIKFNLNNFAGRPIDFKILAGSDDVSPKLRRLFYLKNVDRLFQSGKFIKFMAFFANRRSL